MTIRDRLELRRLYREYDPLKAENSKVFWAIHDSLPKTREWKSRVRRTIDICRVGEEFQRERELALRIMTITGRGVVPVRRAT